MTTTLRVPDERDIVHEQRLSTAEASHPYPIHRELDRGSRVDEIPQHLAAERHHSSFGQVLGTGKVDFPSVRSKRRRLTRPWMGRPNVGSARKHLAQRLVINVDDFDTAGAFLRQGARREA